MEFIVDHLRDNFDRNQPREHSTRKIRDPILWRLFTGFDINFLNNGESSVQTSHLPQALSEKPFTSEETR